MTGEPERERRRKGESAPRLDPGPADPGRDPDPAPPPDLDPVVQNPGNSSTFLKSVFHVIPRYILEVFIFGDFCCTKDIDKKSCVLAPKLIKSIKKKCRFLYILLDT